MRKRLTLTAMLALLATTFCHARTLTLTEANTIITILVLVVILLLVLQGFSLHYNKVVGARNQQLHRILKALDDYRAIVGDVALPLDKQEELMKKKLSKKDGAKIVQMDESQNFFVKMDARINKDKPYTNPDFNQQALADFMEIDLETFCQLVPRYKDPDRTLDYINSLRAEYAAKLLMEPISCSMDEIAHKCGFRDTAAFNNASKFAFGITPSDYQSSVSNMFKKKAN